MSLNLIPVKSGNENIDTSYRNFLPTTSNLYSCVTTDAHGILYMGFHYANSIMKVYKLNLFTNAFAFIGDISYANLGSMNVGGICADDTYLYVSSMTNTVIRIYDLETLTLKNTCIYTTSAPQSYGKIIWNYDKTRIVLQYGAGFLFFNPVNKTYDFKTASSTWSCRDFCVGNKFVIGCITSTSYTIALNILRIETGEFNTKQIASSALSCACYSEGKYYIAQSGYLCILDEETEEWTYIVCPWGEPRSVNYTNGTVFVTVVNSNRLYLYNVAGNFYRYLYLPWTVRGLNKSYVTIPTAVNGFEFIPYNTLARVGCIGSAKYNFGHIVDSISILYNDQNESIFQYNPEFIKFTESYMTMKDGDIKYPLNIIDFDNHIKSTTIRKSDYKKIQGFKLT